MTKTLQKIKVGLNYLNVGKTKMAIKYFEHALRESDGTNLQKDVGAFFLTNTARYRREWKKRRFGNANLFTYNPDVNVGNGWSDVDIAAILVTPDTKRMNSLLSMFLGRNEQGIKFQRRYANGHPLSSWVGESGQYYTRYTQAKNVQIRVGA